MSITISNENFNNIISKGKSIRIVLEGFGVLIIYHIIGGYFLAPLLGKLFPNTPFLTIAMLSSSAMSPVVASLYLYFRTGSAPKIVWRKELLLYMSSGIVLAWLVVYLSILIFFSKDADLALDIAKIPAPHKYVLLFLLILWSPVIEETLNRGFFFEILSKKWGRPLALLFSSALFVLSHGMWEGFEMSLILIFAYSVIFTLIYIGGGLLASISTHIFVNAYLFFLNAG